MRDDIGSKRSEKQVWTTVGCAKIKTFQRASNQRHTTNPRPLTTVFVKNTQERLSNTLRIGAVNAPATWSKMCPQNRKKWLEHGLYQDGHATGYFWRTPSDFGHHTKKKVGFVSLQLQNKWFCWNFIFTYNNRGLSYNAPITIIRQIFVNSFRIEQNICTNCIFYISAVSIRVLRYRQLFETYIKIRKIEFLLDTIDIFLAV